jgi:hypothetical protein
MAALAPELARVLREAVEGYKQFCGLAPHEALARALGACPGAEEQARRAPPDLLSWHDLEVLYHRDPAAALDKWVQVRQAAREELSSGVRAAGAVQPPGAPRWWLARFLAVREELLAGAPPRSGAERVLLDLAGQAHTLLLAWQEELIARTAIASVSSRREAGREQVRLDDAQAIEQAMGMVERLHGMLVRALKAAQEMKRLSPPVFIRWARQVNVAEQQVNLAAGEG